MTSQAEKDRLPVDRAVKAICAIKEIYRLNQVYIPWEKRMKELAAEILKPGSDEVIDEYSGGLDALDLIWDLQGDYSWSSNQTEPYRPRALDYYVGRKIEHVWGVGVLTKTPKNPRGNGYGIKLRYPCYCGKSRRVMYAIPGVHTGGFAYLVRPGGTDLLDVRNQVMTCKVCEKVLRSKV